MCPYLVYCDDCNCIAFPLSIPFVFVSRPSMDEAEKYQQRLQAIVVRTSLCFFSVFTFALLPTTSVCLKPTWPPTSCQNNLTAPTSSHVTSVERSRLICTAWSEHAKNIPRLTFWPVFSELWNERLQGLSGCCLTSLECKKKSAQTRVTHFGGDGEGPEWTSACFGAYINSTDTVSACMQCAASLNYFSRHSCTPASCICLL